MLIHKDIIVRVIFTFVFLGITFWVLAPVFVKFLKKKMPGYSSEERDLDTLIRRQKERLRSQYGLSDDVVSSHFAKYKEHEDQGDAEKVIKTQPVSLSKEMQQLYKETQWGGGAFLKDLQTEITKTFSYTLADTKVNAFILLCEKRNYLQYLSVDHQRSSVAIKNYLVALLIFFLLIEETKEKHFYILEKIAKKLNVPSGQLALALQIKLLMVIAHKKELKEDRVFSEVLVLNQYSEETVKLATEAVAKREANLWAKSSSQLFEEMTLALNYSSMLSPMPKMKNRKDFDTAYEILGIDKSSSLEEVKKIYKKMALQKHPDKILSQKLPKILERKGIEHFNQIQEAYQAVIAQKK